MLFLDTPVAALRLGSSLNGSNINEGDDGFLMIFFEDVFKCCFLGDIFYVMFLDAVSDNVS